MWHIVLIRVTCMKYKYSYQQMLSCCVVWEITDIHLISIWAEWLSDGQYVGKERMWGPGGAFGVTEHLDHTIRTQQMSLHMLNRKNRPDREHVSQMTYPCPIEDGMEAWHYSREHENQRYMPALNREARKPNSTQTVIKMPNEPHEPTTTRSYSTDY